MNKGDTFMGRELIDCEVENDSQLIQEYLKLNPTPYCGYAKLVMPFFKANTFHALLGVDINGSILTNTNSFLTDKNFIRDMKLNPNTIKSYDWDHTIYTRIQRVYLFLKDADTEIQIDEEMFLLSNSFSGVNIGHELSILFDRIKFYKQHNLTCPIVLNHQMKTIPRAMEVIDILLPNTPKYFLQDWVVIGFKKLWITPNEELNITKHPDIIKEVIDGGLNELTKVGKVLDTYKDKKVFLVKNTKNANVVSKHNCYRCEYTKEYLKRERNYVILNPEETPIYEIIAYLYFASKIVVSYGGILYGNAIYFNPSESCKRFFINTTDEGPYWDSERYKILKTPCLDLDAHLIQFLYEIEEIDINLKE